jgi:hypothetical protein
MQIELEAVFDYDALASKTLNYPRSDKNPERSPE